MKAVVCRLKHWFTPLGVGLLLLVTFKFCVLYGVNRLWVKDHKVSITIQNLEHHVFSFDKGGR